MIVRKQAVLERFQGKQAVLRLENDQTLLVAKEELGDVAEGTAFSVSILPEAEAALEKESLSRVLLNQILSHGQEKS